MTDDTQRLTDIASTTSRWHSLAVAGVLAALQTTATGLSEPESAERLRTHGPNAFEIVRPVSALRILFDQIRSVVVGLLFVAAALAFLLGDLPESAAIAAVLLINTGLGFITELRARRAMEGLLRLEVPHATVVREGVVREIDSQNLVPGDVIEFESGQVIPADGRLLESIELRTVEAALTGESFPVDKLASADVDEDAPLPERENMVFRSTSAVSGSARAVVVATGMATQVGRIGRLAGAISTARTPLEHRLDALGKRLVLLTLGLAALVTGLGALRGVELGRMIETGLALAIAAVPEGLPVVATIALAVGLRRMARRSVLIRRLPVVEALGSATVVCADKTGTLTAGQTTATEVALVGRDIRVSGVGFEPLGEFLEDGHRLQVEADPQLHAALQIAALANNATRVLADRGWEWRGDPTEIALLVAASKSGLELENLAQNWPRRGEIPFSSERRLMATVHPDEPTGSLVCIKGAPEEILDKSLEFLGPAGPSPFDDASRARLLDRNRLMAANGLRVLALAHKSIDGTVEDPASGSHEEMLSDLTFVGLIGMIDPPAPGVHETIEKFREAGVRVVMLTGDQRLTAEAVGRDLGILTKEAQTIDGRELHRLSPAELARRVKRVAGFSRVSPRDKLRIVSAFQADGEVVAMLGDGVNDAAALKKADVGVAMGIRGADVAKEAADLVLLDDRFPTLAAAVEEGRIVFDNIRKFVFYLFSCNLAEVLLLVGATVAGLPLPLLPLQILWLNLVTDTFPALSLAAEPAEPDLMMRPPHDPDAAILSGRFLRAIGFYAGLITISTLAAYLITLGADGAHSERVTTVSFLTLGFAQIFHLGNARSLSPVITPRTAFANRLAIAAVVLSVGLQLVAVYLSPLAHLLSLVPPRTEDWLVISTLALVPAVVGQLLALRRGPRAS